MNRNQYSPADFSLSEGGPLYKALLKVNLHNSPGKLAIVVLAVTWLPLGIINAFAGTLYSGAGVTFLKDVAIQARLLVALPILIIIRLIIDDKVIVVLKYLSDDLMDAEERELMMTKAFRRAKILTYSSWTELILLFLVISITTSFVKTGLYSELEVGTRSWMAENKAGYQTLSLAGDWTVFISLPIFQFLFFRWLWRYFVWVILLFRLSRARLNLRATHPDGAGGLGIIIMAQKSFSFLFVAASVIISGELMANLLKHPDSFITIRNEIVGFTIFCLVLILFPLLFFSSKLIKLKRDGQVHLSNLGVELSSKFEEEWVNDLPIETRISAKQVDPSMLYDYSGLYDSLEKLRPAPVTLRDLIGIVIPLLVPFIPILFIQFSVLELMQKILKLLV